MMRKLWDDSRPTVQMIGDFRAWDADDLDHFKRSLSLTGQVCIMVRSQAGPDESRRVAHNAVRDRIITELARNGFMHGAEFIVMQVPNITNIAHPGIGDVSIDAVIRGS